MDRPSNFLVVLVDQWLIECEDVLSLFLLRVGGYDVRNQLLLSLLHQRSNRGLKSRLVSIYIIDFVGVPFSTFKTSLPPKVSY